MKSNLQFKRPEEFRKTVLVIDDDEAIREILSILLRYEGCFVVTAGNGVEGLFHLQQYRPDLIILDTHMPIMNGYEFKAALDSDPLFSDIPVFSISAARTPGHELKATGFISKPFDFGEFLAVLRPYL